jgi:hypothetical protein
MCSRDWKSGTENITIAPMSRPRIHEPPPPPVIAALVSAGLSIGTATAMEPWKASEVLELLRSTVRADSQLGPTAPARGTI